MVKNEASPFLSVVAMDTNSPAENTTPVFPSGCLMSSAAYSPYTAPSKVASAWAFP